MKTKHDTQNTKHQTSNIKDNFVIGLVVCLLCLPTPFWIVLLCKEEQPKMLTLTIPNFCIHSFQWLVRIVPSPLFIYCCLSSSSTLYVFPFLLLLCLCKEEWGGVGKSVPLTRPSLGFLFCLHPFIIGLVVCPLCPLAPSHIVLLCKEDQRGVPTLAIIGLCLCSFEMSIPHLPHSPPAIINFRLHPFIVGLFA